MNVSSGSKIVSLLPSATEIICALGLESDLVAITHECDFPVGIANRPAITASRISHESMTSAEIDHAVRSQLDGHGSIYDLDTALLESLQPDLIVTQELCDVCAVSYSQVEKAAKIYAAGATVVSLEPNTIDDIFENIITVAELAGVPDKARDVVAQLRSRLDGVRERASAVETRPDVFMLEWLDPPFSPGHWVPQQVETAGGNPLLGTEAQRSVTTTYADILESNPDVLVLIPCGYYKEDTLRQLKNTRFPAAWSEMAAVRNDQVWALDATSYFSRPGPRVVDGVEILAKIFHPEIFGNPTETEAIRVSVEFE
jgi:iron complex transport system substrate-binding protein